MKNWKGRNKAVIMYRQYNYLQKMKQKKSADKLLGLLGKYGKATGCNINTQRLLHFYTPTTNNCHKTIFKKEQQNYIGLKHIVTRSCIRAIYKKSQYIIERYFLPK